jgi:hypothetical protein
MSGVHRRSFPGAAGGPRSLPIGPRWSPLATQPRVLLAGGGGPRGACRSVQAEPDRTPRKVFYGACRGVRTEGPIGPRRSCRGAGRGSRCAHLRVVPEPADRSPAETADDPAKGPFASLREVPAEPADRCQRSPARAPREWFFTGPAEGPYGASDRSTAGVVSPPPRGRHGRADRSLVDPLRGPRTGRSIGPRRKAKGFRRGGLRVHAMGPADVSRAPLRGPADAPDGLPRPPSTGVSRGLFRCLPRGSSGSLVRGWIGVSEGGVETVGRDPPTQPRPGCPSREPCGALLATAWRRLRRTV